MRKLLGTLLALSLLTTAAAADAGPVTGRQAKAHITQRLQHSSKVKDKTRPFRTKLGGKKGDKLRPFVATNVRNAIISAGGGRVGAYVIHVGNRVSGTLNMETGQVRTASVVSPR